MSQGKEPGLCVVSDFMKSFEAVGAGCKIDGLAERAQKHKSKDCLAPGLSFSMSQVRPFHGNNTGRRNEGILKML